MKESFGFHEYVDLNTGVLLSATLFTKVVDPANCHDQKTAGGTFDMFDAKLVNLILTLTLALTRALTPNHSPNPNPNRNPNPNPNPNANPKPEPNPHLHPNRGQGNCIFYLGAQPERLDGFENEAPAACEPSGGLVATNPTPNDTTPNPDPNPNPNPNSHPNPLALTLTLTATRAAR